VILFPAIDLKNGQCVRLEQGDMARATVFNLDPAAQAKSFAAQGFEYLHVVDLDGAFAGKPVNALAVEAMLKAVKMPVQLGGGIRDPKTVEAWLAKGVTRVIIGTAAVPMITREMPLSSQASTVLRSRMPPPSCTGMVTALSMPSTACAFTGLPAKAPSRSTMCRYSNP